MVRFVGLGFFPLVTLYGLIRRRGWAWPAALLVGNALVIWIVVRAAIVGFGHWLQWSSLVLGGVIFILALLPSVRRSSGVDSLRSACS